MKKLSALGTIAASAALIYLIAPAFEEVQKFARELMSNPKVNS